MASKSSFQSKISDTTIDFKLETNNLQDAGLITVSVEATLLVYISGSSTPSATGPKTESSFTINIEKSEE